MAAKIKALFGRRDRLMDLWGIASYMTVAVAVGLLAGRWWGLLVAGVASAWLHFAAERTSAARRDGEP